MSRPTAAPSFESLLARRDLAWMGQNTTHLEPPRQVLDAIETSVRSREFQLYAPAQGLTRLRELILADLGLPSMEAWITDGAVGGLFQVTAALAPTLSRLVTTDPGWPWPARFASLAGVPAVTVPVYDAALSYKMSAEQLAGVIEGHSLVYLIDPLNPLGSRYTRDELEALVDVARSTQSVIVHDCTYRHFATDHSLVAELYPEGTITTYSFSKWLGLAGFRLGAVVAAPELLDRVMRTPSDPLGSGIVAQRAAIAGLEVRDEWLRELRSTNRTNLALVDEVVRRTGLGSVVTRSQGNFCAVDVSHTGWTSEQVCADVLEHDVFIRPGTYQSPGFGERFVKISTSVPTPWVERFCDAWQSLARRAGGAS